MRELLPCLSTKALQIQTMAPKRHYTTEDVPPIGRRVHRIAADLQVLAGQLVYATPAKVVEVCRELAESLPESTQGAEEIVISKLLDDAWNKLSAVVRAGSLDIDLGMLSHRLRRPVSESYYPTAAPHPVVIRARESIRRRHTESDLTAAKIAEPLKISVWHMTRILKLHTGIGFRDHLRSVRIAHAEWLLSASTMSIKEIAGATGFSSARDFDRQFKRVEGVNPSRFRARIRQLPVANPQSGRSRF